jgi:hypothetical protein
MGFTIAYEGGLTDRHYADYARAISRTLLKGGVSLDHVPRVPFDEAADRWLYVWQDEPEARDFVEGLRRQTRDKNWTVRRIDSPPSFGPLHPIEVRVGFRRDGWAFDLAPLARWAIQQRYPDSCKPDNVFIPKELEAHLSPAPGDFRALAQKALLILTDLDVQRLRPFGRFRVVEPQEDRVILPPTSIQGDGRAPGEGGERRAGDPAGADVA